MCGRYSLTIEQEALAAALGVEALVHPRPRYNIAPTQEAPVILRDAKGPRGDVQRWGLVPSWMESPRDRAPMINARSETAHRLPSFRAAFRNRRCLVPADGFFEWRATDGGKVPYWIHSHDGAPVTFAGLSERWVSEEGEVIDSYTILTTDADPRIRPIHDRMPVVLTSEERRIWLEPESSVDSLRELLAGRTSEGLEVTQVSRRVNSPAHDDPACVQPVDAPVHDPSGDPAGSPAGSSAGSPADDGPDDPPDPTAPPEQTSLF